VVNPSDPNSNYQITPISWSNNSTDWEAAREQLANIIIAPTLRRQLFQPSVTHPDSSHPARSLQ
jgi:hypothetical protein